MRDTTSPLAFAFFFFQLKIKKEARAGAAGVAIALPAAARQYYAFFKLKKMCECTRVHTYMAV